MLALLFLIFWKEPMGDSEVLIWKWIIAQFWAPSSCQKAKKSARQLTRLITLTTLTKRGIPGFTSILITINSVVYQRNSNDVKMFNFTLASLRHTINLTSNLSFLLSHSYDLYELVAHIPCCPIYKHEAYCCRL